VDARRKPIEAGTATRGESPAAVALDLYEKWRLAPDYPGGQPRTVAGVGTRRAGQVFSAKQDRAPGLSPEAQRGLRRWDGSPRRGWHELL
jgi:hypothetical protein